ncbi:unnamed protein product [Rhizophagus irregularis]|nr:unnamed protein product [Rhizophagus irregularis]
MDEESRHESPNNVGNLYYSMNMILYLCIQERPLRHGKNRWYNINKDGSQEPFLVADKFIQDDQQHFSYDFNDSSTEEEESNPSDSDELELQQEIITGTKRFKSSCEANKTKSKTQHHCKRCRLAGHYQKNCKEEAVNN